MDVIVVISRIITLFLLMAVGLAARRRGYLEATTTTSLGRFVVDVTLPALVFGQMVRTVDRGTWRTDLTMLVVAGLVMLVALGIGWVAALISGQRENRNTLAFLVAVPNWIYLPLPIAQELYGDAGVRAVLIGNISAQLLLWTLGVATLRGKLAGSGALRQAVLNPGILSAVAGIGLALLVPEAGAWAAGTVQPTVFVRGMHTLFSSVEMLGSVTVPLSLLLIGAQLGGLDLRRVHPCRCVPAVLAARLAVAPLVTLGLFLILHRVGMQIPEVPRRVAYLIAAMPVAVSCSVFAERFGGDTLLSARAIAHSTAASILTVPAFFWLTHWLDL